VLFIEAIRVDKDHLQEAVRQELHRERKKLPMAPKIFFPLPLVSVKETSETPFEKSARPRKYLSPAGA